MFTIFARPSPNLIQTILLPVHWGKLALWHCFEQHILWDMRWKRSKKKSTKKIEPNCYMQNSLSRWWYGIIHYCKGRMYVYYFLICIVVSFNYWRFQLNIYRYICLLHFQMLLCFEVWNNNISNSNNSIVRFVFHLWTPNNTITSYYTKHLDLLFGAFKWKLESKKPE